MVDGGSDVAGRATAPNLLSSSLLIASDVEPVGVALVSKGAKGDRLLFVYPFDQQDQLPSTSGRTFSHCCMLILNH